MALAVVSEEYEAFNFPLGNKAHSLKINNIVLLFVSDISLIWHYFLALLPREKIIVQPCSEIMIASWAALK